MNSVTYFIDGAMWFTYDQNNEKIFERRVFPVKELNIQRIQILETCANTSNR